MRWTDGQGDPYALVMEGVSGQLRSENRTATSAPGAYHPRRENWVKVQFSEGRGVNQGRWEVWTKDGTTYAFGSTGASRLWTCTGTEAWKLDTITDPAGNTIEIQYQTITLNDGKNRCGSPNESYPATIFYTTNAGDATAEFTVEFAISTRPSTKSSGTLLYETRKLDAIRLKNAGAQIVREWTFAYATAAPPYPPTTQEGKDVLLTQITTYGAGGAALGPGNALPAMTFEYDRYDPANGINETRTLDWCIGQLIKRQYLRAVNNGYGGRVSFDYDEWRWSGTWSGDPNTPLCANGFKVIRRTADGGRAEAPARVDTYSYPSMVVDNHPVAFIGFPQVTQTDPAGTTTRSQWYAVADSTAPENGLAYHTEVQVGPVIRSTQDHLYDLRPRPPGAPNRCR
ncbi:MAG: hypothetical protein M5U01_02035 [Ardenticatenaceae bacterium]|nr:hypothetical protein [Ardenticatenaceae bacterium]